MHISIFIALLNFSSINGISVAEALKTRLLDGYDNTIRPVLNETETLIMNISLNSMSVLALDPSQETVEFSAEFILQWKDQFLGWNRSEYDLRISTTPLLDASERYISVRYDGLVRQSIYAVFTNFCEMNVDKFPYDKQTCLIKIGPWSYTNDEVHCIAGPNITDGTQYFSGNSEWDFQGINTTLSETTDTDVNFTYSEVHFNLYVKRRPQFYIWVLLIPTYIITVVSIFGLFTPTANHCLREERVNLGITTLLSSAVILQIVASSMPKSSQLPLLGNFILAEIFVVSIGVLFAVLVITLHQRAHTREWRPPKWLLWILRMTGSRKYLTKSISKISHKQSVNERRNYTGEGSILIQNLDDALFGIREYLKEEDRDFYRELTWMKFFDRIDFLLLIVFQISNALLTYFMVK